MTQKVILLLSGVNEKKVSRLVQTNGWKLAYTQSECSQVSSQKGLTGNETPPPFGHLP